MGTQKNTLIFQIGAYREIRDVKKYSLWIKIFMGFWADELVFVYRLYKADKQVFFIYWFKSLGLVIYEACNDEGFYLFQFKFHFKNRNLSEILKTKGGFPIEIESQIILLITYYSFAIFMLWK